MIHKPIWVLVGCLALAPLFAPTVWAANTGIAIAPDKTGSFEFIEDFQTPKFLQEAFVTGFRSECWSPGSITNHGPQSWSLIYRFHGTNDIGKIDVQVQQWANSRNHGGINTLYVSHNGLDWQVAMQSNAFPADRHGGQAGILTVPEHLLEALATHTEFWLKLDLINFAGLPTNKSSAIQQIKVLLTSSENSQTITDPQVAARRLWGELRSISNWKNASLDVADPPEHRAPHYYEDMDGWLRPATEWDYPSEFETQTLSDVISLRRQLASHSRHPLALATFVRTETSSNHLVARITVRATKDSTRQFSVTWDGKEIGQFDAAEFFDQDKSFYVAIPGPHPAGIHELKMFGADKQVVHLRRITIAGDGQPTWTTRPALATGGSLKLISAYYMPDPSPPIDSQAVEGRHKTQEVGLNLRYLQKMYSEHKDFGAVRVVLHNDSPVPVRIGDSIQLNGVPVEDHYVDFRTSEWDARGVVWYRVRPRLVQPGRCAQVYIRFRRRPAGNAATLHIPVANSQDIETEIPYDEPAAVVDYVTTDASMQKLYVYVRRVNDLPLGRVTGLSIDGTSWKNTAVYGADFPGNVSLLVAKLDKPAERGAYHVVSVHTDDDQTVAAQFRVMNFFYPRSSIHVPSELCAEMNMNLGMWHIRGLEECEKYDILTTAHGPFQVHERLAFVLGPDEPDAHDNRGGGHAKGLGSIARKLSRTGWQTAIERFAPDAASWIIMNGTTRPLNWGVYGQVADVSSFDPYPVTYYGVDHAYVRESLNVARQCGAPNRMYGCMEAFGWKQGPGVPASATRGPTPAEYRQNIVQALGTGMKGLTSWVYVANAGGWQADEPCRREIANMNRLIEHVEDELLLATPVDLASTDAGQVLSGVARSDGTVEESWPKERVWASALLAGPDTIIVTAAHHIQASKPGPPDIDPAQNVTITVQLPSFLSSVQGYEVTEDGLTSYATDVDNGQARIHMKAIESGRVFLLKRN